MSTTELASPGEQASAQPFWVARKFSTGVVVWLLTSMLLLGSTAFPASADTVADEQRFVELINSLRSEKGLDPLLLDLELRVQARGWSQEMAAMDSLEHSPNLSTGVSSDWTLLGENVGVTDDGDVQKLFDAFVASPDHYKNLVDPKFGYVGVGVIYGPKGQLWTTHRFMAVADFQPFETAPPTTAAAPEPDPSPTSALPPPPEIIVTPEPSALDIDLVAEVLDELGALST